MFRGYHRAFPLYGFPDCIGLSRTLRIGGHLCVLDTLLFTSQTQDSSFSIQQFSQSPPNMKQLTPEQQKTLRQWAAEGASPSDIQRRLADEFSIKLTYMDVRFLLDDYEVALRDKPQPQQKVPAPKPQPGPMADDADDDSVPFADVDADVVGGAVKVELDRLNRPGSVVSGSVVFSDGVKAQWSLDQYGRLGLDAANKDYHPSPEDIQDFQEELQALLRKQGF